MKPSSPSVEYLIIYELTKLNISLSAQEQRFLPVPLEHQLRLRCEKGSPGPREAQARREGPQRWQAHDWTGN